MVTATVEALHTVQCSTSMWCSQRCGSSSRPLYLLVRHPVLSAAHFTLHGEPVSGADAFPGSWRVREATPSMSPSSLTMARASYSRVASPAAACRPMTKTQVSSRPSGRRALRLCCDFHLCASSYDRDGGGACRRVARVLESGV
jgi:hypothetical protein